MLRVHLPVLLSSSYPLSMASQLSRHAEKSARAEALNSWRSSQVSYSIPQQQEPFSESETEIVMFLTP